MVNSNPTNSILQPNHIFLAILECILIRFCIDMCGIGSGFMAGLAYLHK